MTPSSLTPYTWNLLWQTFDYDSFHINTTTAQIEISKRHQAERWLSSHTHEDVFRRLIKHEGISEQHYVFLIRLVNDLNLKP